MSSISSGAYSVSSNTASTSNKKRVPSKSVRLRKKDAHRKLVNEYTVLKLNARLDKSRCITDEDLADVFAELSKIPSSPHTDECSYYMKCHGHDCSCGYTTVEDVELRAVEVCVDNPILEMVIKEVAEDFPVENPDIDLKMMRALVNDAVTSRINVVQGYLLDHGLLQKTDHEYDLEHYSSIRVPRLIKVLSSQIGLVEINKLLFYPTTTYISGCTMSYKDDDDFSIWRRRLRSMYSNTLLPMVNTVAGGRSMLSRISRHGPPLDDYERCGFVRNEETYIYCSNPWFDQPTPENFYRVGVLSGWGYKRSNLEFSPMYQIPER